MKKHRLKLNSLFLLLWDAGSMLLSLYLVKNLSGWFSPMGQQQLGLPYLENFWLFALLSIAAVWVLNLVLQGYAGVLRFASFGDALREGIVVLVYTLLFFLLDRLVLAQIWNEGFGYQSEGGGMPFTVFLFLACFLYLLLLAGRLSLRIVRAARGHLSLHIRRNFMKKVIIYGAGAAGNHYLSRLVDNPDEGLCPVCFMDDNPDLWGKKVGGIRVFGGLDRLGEAIDLYHAEVLVVAVATPGTELVHSVLEVCKDRYCAVKKFALVDDLYENTPPEQIPMSSLDLRPVDLEELLRRDSVNLNMQAVESFVKGKTVLVTGGAGSIGSELCRQALRFGAGRVIIFDIHENGLFDIGNELGKLYGTERYETVLGSVRDRARLREVFGKYHPAVVFHAAAHKHVPMMEINPREAIKNNVFGTVNVAQEAICHECEKMILISTDKAVNPTNIMGASKRVAEMVLQMFDSQSEKTDLAAVRFGNVLGSNGSVVPFFLKQIESGGPVTVTHPEMKRYFMTIPEAVQLVMEAGAMAAGGEIFVLDMGEPVKIYDLACDLIKYSGLRPNKDIKIVFTGLRPGEKLFEELRLEEESTTRTANKKIFINKPIERDVDEFAKTVKRLQNSIHEENINEMFDLVRELVETFQHDKAYERD